MQELNPELFSDAVARGAGNLERGVTDFFKWSRLMEYQFGEYIRPNLGRIWGAAQDEWLRQRTTPPPLPPISQPGPIPSEPPPMPDQSNYFVRHWRGELPLPCSYWVNGTLGWVVVAILGGLVSAMAASNGLKAVVASGIALYVLSTTVTVWQIVGTWRSATQHPERGGNAAWAALAKVVLVLGVLNLTRLTVFSTVPQVVEFGNILAGDNKLPPYEIRVLTGGTEVEFRGGIRAGSARELERILAAVPQAKVLHVNSVGGRVREAEQMAKLVRGRGLITYTSEECLSAATLMFIAGKERVVSAHAKIGFHQAWLPGMTETQRRTSDEALRQTMRQAGVADDFIDHVLATPHESMWYPTVQEMRRAGVITSQSFGERFAASGEVLRSSAPEDIDKVWRALPGFRAIKEIEPDTYWTLVGEVSTAIQPGKTMTEVRRLVRKTSERLVTKYLPAASDEALLTTRDGWVDLLEKFKDNNKQACVGIFSPKSAPPDFNYGRIWSDSESNNYLELLEKVLRSAAQGASPQLNPRAASEDLARIRSHLRQRYRDDLRLMTNQDEWMDHSQRVCEMLLAYYRETQRLPQQRQGNLLRYLLTGAPPSSSEASEVRQPPPPVRYAGAGPTRAQTTPQLTDLVAQGPSAFPSFEAYMQAYEAVRQQAGRQQNDQPAMRQMLERIARTQDTSDDRR